MNSDRKKKRKKAAGCEIIPYVGIPRAVSGGRRQACLLKGQPLSRDQVLIAHEGYPVIALGKYLVLSPGSSESEKIPSGIKRLPSSIVWKLDLSLKMRNLVLFKTVSGLSKLLNHTW